MSTVAETYLKAVKDYPDRVFMRGFKDGREFTITYEESARRVAWAMAHMHTLGFGSGDVIVCLFEEIQVCVWMYLTCSFLGVVPVWVSPNSPDPFVDQIMERAKAKLLVKYPEFATSYCSYSTGDSLESLSRYATEQKELDLHSLVLTSGSTGEPKLVMRNNYLSETVISDAVGRRRQDGSYRILLASPFCHGQAHQILQSILQLAAQVCIPSQIGVKTSLAEVRQLKPAFMTLVPRALRAFYTQSLNTQGDLFPGCHVVQTVGAAPDIPTLTLLAEQGVTVGMRYGQSETRSVTSGENNLGRIEQGYTGCPYPDVVLRWEDDELLVSSPRVAIGYYNDPERTRETFTDGFVRTGDCVAMDEGSLRYVGRKTGPRQICCALL